MGEAAGVGVAVGVANGELSGEADGAGVGDDLAASEFAVSGGVCVGLCANARGDDEIAISEPMMSVNVVASLFIDSISSRYSERYCPDFRSFSKTLRRFHWRAVDREVG